MVEPDKRMDRAISSLEQRLRTMQLNACIPEKQATSTHRKVWYAFRTWRAHPHIPSWHLVWLRKKGYVREEHLKEE